MTRGSTTSEASSATQRCEACEELGSGRLSARWAPSFAEPLAVARHARALLGGRVAAAGRRLLAARLAPPSVPRCSRWGCRPSRALRARPSTSASESVHDEPSLAAVVEATRRQLAGEHVLELGPHLGGRVARPGSRSGRAGGRPSPGRRVRRRSRSGGAGRATASRSPPTRPSVSKIAAPSGIAMTPGRLATYSSPFATERTRERTCSSSASIVACNARRGSSGSRREHDVDAVVEAVGAEVRTARASSRRNSGRARSRRCRVRRRPPRARTTGRKCLKPALPSAGSRAKRKLPRQ